MRFDKFDYLGLDGSKIIQGGNISPSLDQTPPKNPPVVHTECTLLSELFQVLASDRMRGRKMVALMMTVALMVKQTVALMMTVVLSLLAKVDEL
mmetsp:Transcript_26717/g.49140  ORF Transcript_26717/g.49140 Transcript_26717/m.49140 type:complete len:94 (-) Transcript_26717:1203-1484(-)